MHSKIPGFQDHTCHHGQAEFLFCEVNFWQLLLFALCAHEQLLSVALALEQFGNSLSVSQSNCSCLLFPLMRHCSSLLAQKMKMTKNCHFLLPQCFMQAMQCLHWQWLMPSHHAEIKITCDPLHLWERRHIIQFFVSLGDSNLPQEEKLDCPGSTLSCDSNKQTSSAVCLQKDAQLFTGISCLFAQTAPIPTRVPPSLQSIS